jgi:hypothetical protein
MRRLTVVFCLIIALVVAILVVIRPAPPIAPAPVVVMPQPYSMPLQRISLFNKWVPRTASWAWLWRLKEQLIGRPKAIALTTTFVDFTGSGTAYLTKFSLPKPQFINNTGLAVWLLNDTELTRLQELLKQHPGADLKRYPGTDIVASPRITTADGMQARLFSGTTIPINGLQASVGQSVDLLARVRRETTDLTIIINSSEAITNQPDASLGTTNTLSVQTNLAIAARIQIPNAMGAFLLDTDPSSTRHQRTGVILSLTLPPRGQ